MPPLKALCAQSKDHRATEKFQSWAIPAGGNIVRNTSVTRDGDFVLANSLMNDVTLVSIKRD